MMWSRDFCRGTRGSLQRKEAGEGATDTETGEQGHLKVPHVDPEEL